MPDREVTDHRVGVNVQAVLLFKLSDSPAGLFDVEQTVLGEFIAENHIFDDGKYRDQLEVLMDHADTLGNRIVHTIEADLGAAHPNAASVGLVQTEHDVHQGALAGAVLAKQAVNFALVEGQADVFVGDHAGEGLGDVANLEDRDLRAGGVQRVRFSRRGTTPTLDDRGLFYDFLRGDAIGPDFLAEIGPNLYQWRSDDRCSWSVAGRPVTQEQPVDPTDSCGDAAVGEAGAGSFNGGAHLCSEDCVMWLGVGDHVVRCGTYEEAAFEGVLNRISDQAERDEVNALDGRAGEVLRTRSATTGEGGEVLVLVDSDGPCACFGCCSDAARACLAAGTKDDVSALSDELGSVRCALGDIGEALVVNRQYADVGVNRLGAGGVAIDELDHWRDVFASSHDTDNSALAE